MSQLKYSKVDNKTHFISGANFYVFRYQGTIIKEFFSNKVCVSGYYFRYYLRRPPRRFATMAV